MPNINRRIINKQGIFCPLYMPVVLSPQVNMVGAPNGKPVYCPSIGITPPTQKESPHSDQNYIQLTFCKAKHNAA